LQNFSDFEKMATEQRKLTSAEVEKVSRMLALGDCNRSEIARALGMNPQQGALTNRLISDPRVQKKAKEMVITRFERANISADRVMTEIARLAFSNAKDLFDDTGKLLGIHEMSDDAAATIVGFDVEERETRDGVPYTVKKVKRGDKLGALTLLAKHFKLVNDNEGINAYAQSLADRLNAAKKRVLQPGADGVYGEQEGVEALPHEAFEPLPGEPLPDEAEAEDNADVAIPDAVEAAEEPVPEPPNPFFAQWVQSAVETTSTATTSETSDEDDEDDEDDRIY
jgi:phage terminase small subunit